MTVIVWPKCARRENNLTRARFLFSPTVSCYSALLKKTLPTHQRPLTQSRSTPSPMSHFCTHFCVINFIIQNSSYLSLSAFLALFACLLYEYHFISSKSTFNALHPNCVNMFVCSFFAVVGDDQQKPFDRFQSSGSRHLLYYFSSSNRLNKWNRVIGAVDTKVACLPVRRPASSNWPNLSSQVLTSWIALFVYLHCHLFTDRWSHIHLSLDVCPALLVRWGPNESYSSLFKETESIDVYWLSKLY